MENIDHIHDLIRQAVQTRDSAKQFVPGQSKVHYSGPIFDDREVNAVIDSLLAGWLAEGEKTMAFEREFAGYIGKKEAVVVNSGSSALLIAFKALMHRSLDRPMQEGDEVITSALTFPTAINAIILNRLTPVFVDVDIETCNMSPELIEGMITNRTRAILVTHHLGYPCDMDAVMTIAEKHDLCVVEDCCDAHGAEYKGKKLGGFGKASCFSFYCAHTMTMGEGGAVLTDDPHLRSILMSLKTCGRACTCPACSLTLDPDAACRLRWQSDIEGFSGFDKRTLFTDIGYKFKILDLQCAIGLEQLQKLPGFVEARLRNAEYLTVRLQKHSRHLMLPKVSKDVKPSWFAYPVSIRKGAPFTRKEICDFLEKHNIETRPLLGGNMLRQPAYQGFPCRTTGLANTDYFHDHGFYVGCYPGLTKEMLDYIIDTVDEFIRTRA